MTDMTGLTVITTTDAAKKHFESMLKKLGAQCGMRLSVKNSGCSGKKYVLEPVVSGEKIIPTDKVYSLIPPYSLYVEADSLPYLAGVEIDYVKKNLKGQIVFNNPQEKSHCGCGESFYV